MIEFPNNNLEWYHGYISNIKRWSENQEMFQMALYKAIHTISAAQYVYCA